jgi:PPOX class probable F420-dependent enzyme
MATTGLAEESFLALTTFKRDGTPVSVPVWCAGENGTLLVFSEANSWKVKRIRRDPHVQVAPCSARGRPRGPAIDADAAILADTATVEALLARKYRRLWPAYTRATAAARWLKHQAVPASVTIRITPRQGDPAAPLTASPSGLSEGSRVVRVLDAARLLGVLLSGVWSRRPVRLLPGEAARALPGDQLGSEATVVWTHGITIRARPGQVWPWLVQMGCRRAGWYSYDGLDNGGLPSANQILPELQRLQVGDILPMTPNAEDAFVVRAVEPERALVLGDAAGSATWAFALEPSDDGTSTRLVTRSTGSYTRVVVGLLLKLFLRPIHFAMQRKQLLNLKRLVEEQP